MDAKRGKSNRLGVIVAGAGFLGAQRAAAARVARSTRLVAVTDPDLGRARRVAERHGVPAVATLAEGLDLPGVDLAVIASPHAEHDDAVRQSLRAGKAVLCEKPLATDPEQARDLARLADERGLRLATGFNHRFYPPVRDALRIVAAWAIGRVEAVQLTIGHAASAEFLAGWHADRAVSGGGTLMDNGVHALDLARKFLGEMTVANGSTRDTLNLPFGIESEAFAHFRNHERGVAEVRSSWTLRTGYLTIEVSGSAGFLKVETAPWRLSGRLADGSRVDRRYLVDRVAERVFRRRFGCERSLVWELDDFASGGLDGPRLGASGWDGARATEMADAVYRASASGGDIALPGPSCRPEVEAPHGAGSLAV